MIDWRDFVQKFDPLETPHFATYVEFLAWANIAMTRIIVNGEDVDLPQSVVRQLYLKVLLARENPVKTWHGLDVRHIIQQQGKEYGQLDVFASFQNVPPKYLTQEVLDFLTLRDNPAAKLDCYISDWYMQQIGDSNSERVAAAYAFGNTEHVNLVKAFTRQMAEDAMPHRYDIVTGFYVLDREPLAVLDQAIRYDQMRLVVVPEGILMAIIVEDSYITLSWSPYRDLKGEYVTEAATSFVPRDIAVMLEMLAAAIWRDACIKEERVFVERRDRGRGYTNKTDAPVHISNTIRLPRVVYKTQWGSAADRETVDSVSRRAHMVRGHYRLLPGERKQSEKARDKASEYGYPEPPSGYTFVIPHARGTGEALPKVRKVVCKGLLTLRTVLS